MRLVVIDVGAGNVRSVVRAVERASSRPVTVVDARASAAFADDDVVVFPGQGSFAALGPALDGGLRAALQAHLGAGRPYLGICLGMQVLFETSAEAPGVAGLGVLRGAVERLEPGVDPVTAAARPLPHIGWNAVDATSTAAAEVLGPGRHFYFAHSFAARTADPEVVAATTEYGPTFPSAVAQGALLGVQFHPEKSQVAGRELLARFFARFVPAPPVA